MGYTGKPEYDKAYPAEPLLENAFAAVFGKPAIIYPGYQLAYLPNPRLRWEKVEAWETGFETNMFRNRFHFEGVYYKKNTKDLLATVRVCREPYRASAILERLRTKVSN